jgi:hypothetical protein
MRSWDLEVHVASSWPAQEHNTSAQGGGKWEEIYGWGRGNIGIWEKTTMYSNDYDQYKCLEKNHLDIIIQQHVRKVYGGVRLSHG